ncbi:uncharacterized protein KY384_000959 [Bacidia gigantensis]|uniref:uncharacterized protein n=1 Tax=Bacidia gigantensis TaxID=2732470 RepID=UPI001D03B63E|nr:uncharacterized protein KY384_000959 [Bacidia gigantensis]KAG8534115.1 hypothetical protein KY384_000959 [Bacidia gigantensis]
MEDRQRVENVLQGLRSFQNTPLSIIRLGEPLSAAQTSNRSSDASSSTLDNPSPASLEADLSHYKVMLADLCENLNGANFWKELFSKLRFSYVEQVTKEKFLRAIVGDPPQIVEHAENVELEAELASIKDVLKQQKQQVTDMITTLEQQGRELASRWETVQLQTTLLESLPSQIDGLKETLEHLRQQSQAGEEGRSDDPNLNLPLPATQALLEERKEELDEVNKQLKTLQQALPRQNRALEREERELKVLEQEREIAVRIAREAVERKKRGGGADELELRGRWLKGVDTGLRQLLDIQV